MKKLPWSNPRNGEKQLMFLLSESEYAAMDDECIGLCVICGEERSQTEPDAENYPCASEECLQEKVFGVPQLLIMGQVDIVDDDEAGVDE